MTAPQRTSRSPLAGALVVIGGLLAIMWGLEAIDQATRNSLDAYGIRPRQTDYLPHVFTAPWLHFGWGHLISNTIPFLVLGVLNFLAGIVRWLVTTASSILGSGLLVWLISPPGTITAGASGLVFGWLAYLLVRGFYTRKLGQIVLAVVVFLFYGGILWGVLPIAVGVSWQAHLGGFMGGVVAAWWLHSGPRRRREAATPAY